MRTVTQDERQKFIFIDKGEHEYQKEKMFRNEVTNSVTTWTMWSDTLGSLFFLGKYRYTRHTRTLCHPELFSNY